MCDSGRRGGLEVWQAGEVWEVLEVYFRVVWG